MRPTSRATLPAGAVYGSYLAEMITVFMNASPMLSE